MVRQTPVCRGRCSRGTLAVGIALALASGCQPIGARAANLAAVGAVSGARGAQREVDLAALARRGELRVSNRRVSELVEGRRRGVRVSAAPGEPAIWLPGFELATGTIELELRGKDLQGQSFVGVAFGGVNDSTFEAVYLRPFNFRAADPVRKARAIQYIQPPGHPWEKLRSERPEVYENPLEPAPDPNDWVRLRVVVERTRVRAYAGEGSEPDLVVDRLGGRTGRRVGLWIGNGSEGAFANLRLTPAR